MRKTINIIDIMKDEIPEKPYFWANLQVPLAQILRNYALDLFHNREVSGIVIKDNDKNIGFLPRETLLELAEGINTRDWIEIGGDSQTHPVYLVCPQKKCLYRELVVFFDPLQPPRCSYHNLMLKREER